MYVSLCYVPGIVGVFPGSFLNLEKPGGKNPDPPTRVDWPRKQNPVSFPGLAGIFLKNIRTELFFFSKSEPGCQVVGGKVKKIRKIRTFTNSNSLRVLLFKV